MAIIQHRAKRSKTGSVYKAHGKKKQYQIGRQPTFTKIGEARIKFLRVMGANTKLKLLTAENINLIDPKTKKAMKAKLKTVVGNPANSNFVRRNILTKGSIIETDKGKARITSRPGQEGTVNAVLVQ